MLRVAVAADPPTTTYILWEPLLQSFLADFCVDCFKEEEGFGEIVHLITKGNTF